MKLLLTYISLIIISTNGFAHHLHLSLTNIERRNDTIELFIKLKTEDIESILNYINKDTLNIGLANEDSKSNIYISNYINEHFKVSINNSLLSFSYSNKYCSEGFVWITMQALLKENKNSIIHIENTIMIDIYADQKNLVLYSSNEIQSSMQFDAFTTKAIIK